MPVIRRSLSHSFECFFPLLNRGSDVSERAVHRLMSKLGCRYPQLLPFSPSPDPRSDGSNFTADSGSIGRYGPRHTVSGTICSTIANCRGSSDKRSSWRGLKTAVFPDPAPGFTVLEYPIDCHPRGTCDLTEFVSNAGFFGQGIEHIDSVFGPGEERHRRSMPNPYWGYAMV